MSVLMPEPKNTMLGKETTYTDQYNPDLLQPIPRALGRDAIGDHDFQGTDIWRLYELSWLNAQGIPQTAVGELFVPANSHSIIESKSLKLYAGSFAMTKVDGPTEVASRIREDLSCRLGADVQVRLYPLHEYPQSVRPMPGVNLDMLSIPSQPILTTYETDSSLLRFADNSDETIRETYCTTAFRSLCPVTGQPDLAALTITYEGKAIDPVGLLKYLISYRCHRGFHEQCVEQIFHDLRTAFEPTLLEVYACFTRRGGIDINPFRSSYRQKPSEVIREIRQ